MVKIGDALFVSSVEIKVRTRRFPQPVDGYDRDAGEGVGHLFKIDMAGNLMADLTLGEGAMYHPGGIDYDGTHIWVPVAEYRPNSRSIVYRVDPGHDEGDGGVPLRRSHRRASSATPTTTRSTASAGARAASIAGRSDADGKVTNASAPEKLRTLNTSHYVDYQDCKYAGRRRMLCTGVTEMRQSPDAPPFRLGGIDLVDLARRPSRAPGAGSALDGRRAGHDAQPGVDRADRDAACAATSCPRTTSRRSTSTTWTRSSGKRRHPRAGAQRGAPVKPSAIQIAVRLNQRTHERPAVILRGCLGDRGPIGTLNRSLHTLLRDGPAGCGYRPSRTRISTSYRRETSQWERTSVVTRRRPFPLR